ncbi:hypothetical protein WG922_07700 [Ramlibacter sp. AN1015]|uniref:hypothetical protein n=1 Tax=Ramlibacter sp. AN1015 TaxID=3133428 RepID=UPI0030BAA8CF
MPFTTNLTGTAQVDSSILLAYDRGIIVAAGQAQIMEPFVSTKVEIGAKSISFTKFGRIAPAVTPLTETEDVTSVALSDSEILLTPREYGMAVTKTNLASLQTGGKVDLAAATLVGMNMGQTMDALAIAALLTSANVEASATTGAQVDGQYTKLASKSIPMIDGAYTLLANEAEIAVLRNEAGFTDVAKYANAQAVLKNEVGFYKGHRVVRHQGVTAGTSISFGGNALGKAVSQEAGMRLTAGGDKLGRFAHLGWYGVFVYGLVDSDAVEVLSV